MLHHDIIVSDQCVMCMRCSYATKILCLYDIPLWYYKDGRELRHMTLCQDSLQNCLEIDP